MRSNLHLLAIVSLAPLAAITTLTGCEEKKPVVSPSPATQPGDHAPGHPHDLSPDHTAAASRPSNSAPGHGGGIIDLLPAGTNTFGPFTITKASRDKSDVIPGNDAAFDVTIVPTEPAGPKVAAVRFWIGTDDAKGSVKAKAEIEDPNDPSRWHAHAEVPSPMPAASKFYFEIEDDKGATHIGSFDLKM